MSNVTTPTTSIPWLDEHEFSFPPLWSAQSNPNGLLAAGGCLSPERLLAAYCQGIFPWYEQNQPILWWSPAPRCVLKPDEVHISRSLKRTLRSKRFHTTADTAFDRVIAACAQPRSYTNDTWITADMRNAYQHLFELGHAHSIEVWNEDDLVGGLYGLAIGRVFFGESMFSTQSDASKVALVRLCQQLLNWGYVLLDCQVENPHLASLGASTMPRDEFQQLLKSHTTDGGVSGTWKDAWADA